MEGLLVSRQKSEKKLQADLQTCGLPSNLSARAIRFTMAAILVYHISMLTCHQFSNYLAINNSNGQM